MRVWCPTCRRRETVVDRSVEGHYAFGREVAYTVEWLACGHENQGAEVDAGPAPGAPEPMPRGYVLGMELADPWAVTA